MTDLWPCWYKVVLCLDLYNCCLQLYWLLLLFMLDILDTGIWHWAHLQLCLSNCLFCFTVPPKIYDISSDITVNEGSNVSLICTASGKPEPKIFWRHITPSGEFKAVIVKYVTIRPDSRCCKPSFRLSHLESRLAGIAPLLWC